MKVALYARVSSDQQAEKNNSIPSQLRLLHKYAEDHNMEVFKEYINREDFFICWNRIKKQMRKNSWNDPRIEYWQAIYDTLRKIPEIAELKQIKFKEPKLLQLDGEVIGENEQNHR